MATNYQTQTIILNINHIKGPRFISIHFWSNQNLTLSSFTGNPETFGGLKALNRTHQSHGSITRISDEKTAKLILRQCVVANEAGLHQARARSAPYKNRNKLEILISESYRFKSNSKLKSETELQFDAIRRLPEVLVNCFDSTLVTQNRSVNHRRI